MCCCVSRCLQQWQRPWTLDSSILFNLCLVYTIPLKLPYIILFLGYVFNPLPPLFRYVHFPILFLLLVLWIENLLCTFLFQIVWNRIPGENHRPVASHWQTWSCKVVSSTPRHEQGSTHIFSGDRHVLPE
jgi:hypothetical protein